MRRFAAHYIYIPSYGFLKQYVVEINSEGFVCRLYPLMKEIESVIWAPGVIGIFPSDNPDEKPVTIDISTIAGLFTSADSIQQEPQTSFFQHSEGDMANLKLLAVRLYPFNYVQMKPIKETVAQLLDYNTFLI